MKNKLYNEHGFFDFDYIMADKNPFILIIGSRGTGKTYSCLKWLYDNDKRFALLRLTDKEVQFCANQAGNPFKAINRDHDLHVEVRRINQYMFGFYDGKDANEYKGLCMALTTMSKIRGADMSDIDFEIIDEFIPEKIVKKISGIGEAVLQSYETINRNRELFGRPPLKLVMMANALNINNEILIKFGVVSMLQKMKKRGIEIMRNVDRGITVIYPMHTPIAEMKKETALYKVSKRFNEMALDNKFREYYEDNIASRKISNYRIFTGFDNMYFYKSKINQSYYVTGFRDISQQLDAYYHNTDFEVIQFKRKYWYLLDAYYNNRIKFESPEIELDFINLMGVK